MYDPSLEVDDTLAPEYVQLSKRFELRVPQELRDLKVEDNVWRELCHYVWLGLPPGSYGDAILLGDYDLAIQRSHALIRIWRDQHSLDVTQNMIRCVQILPMICWGDRQRIDDWQRLGGLSEQPNHLMLFRLTV